MSSCEDSLRAVARVPPSVQSVYCTLYGHDPMTGQQLREQTGLPRRTVYAALQRLKEVGVLRERPSLRDTRQTYYWVAGSEPVRVPVEHGHSADASERPAHAAA
jgi:DNA-binding MarR family transcriptional regulator